MQFSELVERAKRELTAGQPQPHNWAEADIDLAACVKQACDAVARRTMLDGSRRAWLQQEFTLALDGNGKGVLASATSTIAGEILLEGIWMGGVIDASGEQLNLVLHYADFLRLPSLPWGSYCLKDRSILTCAKNQPVTGANSIAGATGPLVITASYVPSSVDDFPPDLETDLIQALVEIVARKLTPPNADA